MSVAYVHGYNQRENDRLRDQAGALVNLLHHDTAYPPNADVLEAGCGVGAQTVTLARNSPRTRFVSIDISQESLTTARRNVLAAGLTNVQFMCADVFSLPFPHNSFDHIFVCFLLEHLPDPAAALLALKERLKPNGTITVIEGDHGSTYFHPDNVDARDAVQCLVDLQRMAGGNGNIGRQVYPLLVASGFADVAVSPRMVYVDSSRPDLVESFTKKTFTAMVEGVRERALTAGLAAPQKFDAGVRALYRTAEADGVFCYTFFKGLGRKS